METEQNILQMKLRARQALRGNYGVAIVAGLLYSLLYSVIVGAVQVNPQIPWADLWMTGASVVVSLLSGVFFSGFAYLNLRMVYGEKPRVNDLFHGFREEPNKAIQIQVIFALAALICSIPSYWYSKVTGENGSLWMALFLSVLGPALSFVLTLPFAQAFYLLQDFPDRSVKDLLSASVRLMKGKKKKLLQLTVSFFPQVLMSALFLFIPLFWILADYRASRAIFYQELLGRAHGSH